MNRKDAWLSTVLRAAPLVLFLWMVRSLLVPLALGGLFALLLYPLKRRLMRRSPRIARHAPMILTSGALVLVVIPFVVVATRVVVSAQTLLSGGIGEVVGRVQDFLTRNLTGPLQRLRLPVDSLRSGALEIAQRVTSSIANFASGVASSLPGQIVDLFIFVLALYFFLRDGKALLRWMMRLSPFPESDTDELFDSIQRTVQGAIVGQLATSAVQGGLTLIALYALQVPGALLLGILAMLLSVLPLVGTMPVTLGAAIYLLASGRFVAAGLMAGAAILIGVSDNVVRPWVQSRDTRMHPLITLLAIFGGIELLGAAGVFLGPVIAAIAIWTIDLYAGGHQHPVRSSLAPEAGRAEAP